MKAGSAPGSNRTGAIFPHPSPHTLTYGLLVLPLSYLDYKWAAYGWLLLELVCLVVTVVLLLRWWGARVTAGRVALIALAALGWQPLTTDLWLGQLNLLLLLLLVLAWLALREGRDAVGGALLGGLIALKMMAWPLVILLVMQRRWRSVLAAAAVLALMLGVNACVIGVGGVLNYYTQVGPALARLYAAFHANYSLWTLGPRLFAGTRALVYTGLTAPPLVESPLLARLFGMACALAVLGLGLWRAYRARHFDSACGVLVMVNLLVNPICWSHYVVLAVLPILVVTRRAWDLGETAWLQYATLVLTLLVSLPSEVYAQVAALFAVELRPGGEMLVPFAAGLVTLLPMVWFGAWIWLIERSERESLPTVTKASIAWTAQPTAGLSSPS